MGSFVDDLQRVKDSIDLKEYAGAILQRSKGGFFCCPACGSGEHGTAKSDGALSVKGDTWKCFSCGAGGDVFDLAGIRYSTQDKREQLETVAAWAGIVTEGDRGEQRRPAMSSAKREPSKDREHEQGQAQEEKRLDQAREAFGQHTEALAYWQARGFTEQEAAAFGIGYDAKEKRLVLPWAGSSYYHIDRDITGTKESDKYRKPPTERVGAQPFYNPEALKEPAFFIVEGVLDALAVEACGFEAVALGGTGAEKAVQEMQARGVSGVAICLLDNDEPGREASEKLCSLLEAAGIIHIEGAIPGHKDAAEALEADREALRATLEEAHNDATGQAQALQEEQYRQIMQAFRVRNPLDVAMEIYDLTDAQEPIPTGLETLDEYLGGGLVPGLYGLGAVSSLGKTTLAIQIADHVAANNERGAIFFTIEQSAKEITAKSLSRFIAELHPEFSTTTASEICSPGRRRQWDAARNGALIDACNAYTAKVAPRLGIQEGLRQPSVKDVEAVAQAWKMQHGQAPVIFIDYLQLMAAPSDRDTDKQATDKNVMALRQLARDMKTPVVIISSLNRNSYNEGVTLDSWKESGAIEYGSDVLLGLQPEGTDEKLDDTSQQKQRREGQKIYRENKQATERACEVKILKNRHGRAEVKVPLTFKTLSSTFEEKQEKPKPKRNII